MTFNRQFVWTTVAAFTISVAGCAAARAAGPRPFPGASDPPNAPSAPAASDRPDSSAVASEWIATALALRGTRYRLGGSEPSRGFDCSGLVQWVFAQHGTALPRESREQYAIGKKIDDDDVRPGDLVFFETVSKGASHVGIALGDGEFVHAPSSRGIVRVESYTRSEYWAKRWLGARRIALTNGSPLRPTIRPAARSGHRSDGRRGLYQSPDPRPSTRSHRYARTDVV